MWRTRVSDGTTHEMPSLTLDQLRLNRVRAGWPELMAVAKG